MKRTDMEAQLKSRGRGVPKSVGRTVGVLPIETSNTTRKPIPPRLPPNSSASSTAGSRLPAGSSTRTRPPPSSSTGARRNPSSRASSTTSYRSLASSSARSLAVPEFDLGQPDEQDVCFTDVPSSAASTARSTVSANTARSTKSVKKAEECQVEKKTFSPSEILAMCQEEDFYKVYEVDLHGAEMTHIPDMEKFRKLRVADLSGNYVRKIQNLDFLQDLRDLKLYDNKITKVEGLDSLKELCNLQLQHNGIETLGKALSNQKKMKCLRLDSNHLTKLDTNELLSCVQLTTLDISNNRINNLNALSYLPNLEELFMSGNRLTKLTDLHRCKKLQEVDLSRNLISDLSGLSGLPALQILDVSENQLKSLSSIGKLKSLEDLNASFNQLAEFTSWGSCFPKLQILNICDNMVESWKHVCSLKELPDLVEVYLAGNPVTLEDGECPTYHTDIQAVLPSLEIVDGAHVKRSGNKAGAAPLMRPMSASSVVSVRQVDAQLKSTTHDQECLQKSIAERFASLKSVFDSLPAQPPSPLISSARSEGPERPPSDEGASPAKPQPSSRCSRRIRDAQAFASSITDDVV